MDEPTLHPDLLNEIASQIAKKLPQLIPRPDLGESGELRESLRLRTATSLEELRTDDADGQAFWHHQIYIGGVPRMYARSHVATGGSDALKVDVFEFADGELAEAIADGLRRESNASEPPQLLYVRSHRVSAIWVEAENRVRVVQVPGPIPGIELFEAIGSEELLGALRNAPPPLGVQIPPPPAQSS